MTYWKYLGALSLGSLIGLASTIFYKNKVEEEQKKFFNENPSLYKCVIFEKSLDDCIKNIEKVKTSKSIDEKLEYLNLASSSAKEPFEFGVWNLDDARFNEKIEKSLLNLRISIKNNGELESKNFKDSLLLAEEIKNHYSMNFSKLDKDIKDEYLEKSVKLKGIDDSKLGYFILFTMTTPIFIVSSVQSLFKYIRTNLVKEESD